MGAIARNQSTIPTPIDRPRVVPPCDTTSITPRTVPTQLSEVSLPKTTLKVPTVWGAPPVILSSTLVEGQDVDSVLQRYRKLYIQVGRFRMNSFWNFTSGGFDAVDAREFFNQRVSIVLKNIKQIAGLPDSFPVEISEGSLKENSFVYVVDVEEFSQDIEVSYEENAFAHLVQWGSAKMRTLLAYTPRRQEVRGSLLEQFGVTVSNWFTTLQEKALKSKSWVANVISGGRVELPTVWDGTAYRPTVKFSIHFYASEPTVEKVWEDIVVPLSVLTTLTAPILMGSGIALMSPPQVRIFVPGLFYMPVGFLQSLSISCPEVTTDDGLQLGVNVVATFSPLFATFIRDSEIGKTTSATGAPLASEVLAPLVSHRRILSREAKKVRVDELERTGEIVVIPDQTEE